MSSLLLVDDITAGTTDEKRGKTQHTWRHSGIRAFCCDELSDQDARGDWKRNLHPQIRQWCWKITTVKEIPRVRSAWNKKGHQIKPLVENTCSPILRLTTNPLGKALRRGCVEVWKTLDLIKAGPNNTWGWLRPGQKCYRPQNRERISTNRWAATPKTEGI